MGSASPDALRAAGAANVNPGGWLGVRREGPHPWRGLAWATLSTGAVLGAVGIWQHLVAPDPKALAALVAYTTTATEPWRLVTHLAVQPNLLHLVVNVGFLLLLGRAVEGRLGAFGFFCVVVLGGVASALTAGVLETVGPAVPILGAQGAVVALGAATLVADFSGFAVARAMPLALLWPGTVAPTSFGVRPDYIGTGGLWNLLALLRLLFIDTPHSFPSVAHIGGFAAGLTVALLVIAGRVMRGARDDQEA